MSEIVHKEFEGTQFRLANYWQRFLSYNLFNTRPINYLEIGTFYGANLFSVANTYASHPESKLYCIDPWIDYTDYDEYKTQQNTIYNTFNKNLESFSEKHKINVFRGYSNNEVPKLSDEYFDIIYIDGNHEPEYVLEDAVLCFRKLKEGGIMIFDDYGWGGPDLTKRGIDSFVHAYYKKINILGEQLSQVFIQKIKSHT